MIYFITDGEYTKIGFTEQDDVEKRLKALQIGNPRKLYIIGVIQGGYKEEAILHKVFAKLRASGEWFAVSPESVESVEKDNRDELVLTDSCQRVYDAIALYPTATNSQIAEYLGVSRQAIDKQVAKMKDIVADLRS